jgi:glycosyltransferase involved in cell wall biosynthesis
LDQLEFLRAKGFDVQAMSAPGPGLEVLRAHGFETHTAPLTRRITPAIDLRALAELTRRFRALRPDVVHTHTPKASLLGQWAALLASVRFRVHTIHGLYFPGHMRPRDRWRFVMLERVSMLPAHLALSQNSEDMKTCIRDRIIGSRRLRFLGNGIDIDRFSPASVERARGSEIRRKLGIPHDHVVVGMVGRLVREKGYLDLFAAAANVTRERPRTTFLAIGAAEPWKPDAVSENDARASGLDGRFKFLGQRDDMPDLYGAMDVLVLPSHREGFPRAPMEAAATGVPVVVTDVRGCREAAIDGVTGLIVPARAPDTLAAALIRMIDDDDLRKRFGGAGRELALERFDQRLVFRRVVAAYEDLAADRR